MKIGFIWQRKSYYNATQILINRNFNIISSYTSFVSEFQLLHFFNIINSTRVGFDGVHGGFGYGSRNQEGEGILNFALAYDLFVTNTLFRKRVSHLVTFSSGQHCSQIDFILARREDRHSCLDCKVIPGECVVPQHKLVVADFRFRIHFQRSKRVQAPRTKW
jgi:hypothetical protein